MEVLILWEGLYCTWARRHFPAAAAGSVVEGDGLVLEADGIARRMGVRPGMPAAAARRICHGREVAFFRHDPCGVLPLVEFFRDACARLTPLVEPLGERMVLLDLGERAEPTEALSRLAETLGGSGALLAGAGAGRGVAVAAVRLARRLAAGGCRGPLSPPFLRRPARNGGLPLCLVAVPGSAGASFLAPCPLALLVAPGGPGGSARGRDGSGGSPFLAEEEVAALARLGVRTCGELLSLPRSSLVQVVGSGAAARMVALCRGEAGPPVSPRWPPPEIVWRSGEETTAGPLLWREAACVLAERLRAAGWAAGEFHLEWKGELGLRRVVKVLPLPVREEGRMRITLAALAERLGREAAGRAGEGRDEAGLSFPPAPLRGIFVVRARGLTAACPRQLSLEGDGGAPGVRGREERLARALAALGSRGGRFADWSSPVRESRLEHWDPKRWRRSLSS